MGGFRKFLMRGNVIDLAVAVVVGVAFNAIVQALVKDMITPLISAIAGSKQTFAKLTLTIGRSQFLYGDVLNALLSFIVIAAVVYFLLVAPSERFATYNARNKAATTRDCPECLSTIPVAARRCMHCTSEVPPVEPSTEVPRPRRSRHGQFAPE